MRELSRARATASEVVMLVGAAVVVWGFTRNSMVGWFVGAAGLIPLLFAETLVSVAKKRIRHA